METTSELKGMTTMIADETPRPHDESPEPEIDASNDNDGVCKVTIDPHLLAIARAIGRQIAREELASLSAANDNHPKGAS